MTDDEINKAARRIVLGLLSKNLLDHLEATPSELHDPRIPRFHKKEIKKARGDKRWMDKSYEDNGCFTSGTICSQLEFIKSVLAEVRTDTTTDLD